MASQNLSYNNSVPPHHSKVGDPKLQVKIKVVANKIQWLGEKTPPERRSLLTVHKRVSNHYRQKAERNKLW